MTKMITTKGPVYAIGVCRSRKCGVNHGVCGNRTRMVLIVPVFDIERGDPGYAAIPVCSECVQESLIKLVDMNVTGVADS